jgi:ATP-binding cassette subfamily B protein
MLYFLDLSYGFVQKIRLYLVPAQRYFETLNLDPEIVEKPNATRLLTLRGAVEFSKVNFAYDKNFPILKNVSFKIAPGKKLAIVGPSGAGKSTIASLLLRLYDVDDGSVKIDGVDVTRLHMNSVLAKTGVILQDTFLFGGTIRDNIRYSKPDASDAEIESAARAAGIHDDIMAMPGGYDMDVAEGTSLSGGQKQRIAIARALIKKPRLLLLDEATSSLDIATEEGIIDTLKSSFKDITTIFITHRISLIADADKIVVIDKGVVVESGTHRELLANRQLYYDLYSQQTERGNN